MLNTKMLNFAIGVILIIGIMTLSYNYYNMLRITVCIVAGINLITFYLMYRQKKTINIFLVLFMFSAMILFNPIIPIYMDKSSWIIFDGIFGVSFILHSIFGQL